MLQEEAGRLKFVCLSNDGIDEHMVWYSISSLSLNIHVRIFPSMQLMLKVFWL
jgi:hypothetical protein